MTMDEAGTKKCKNSNSSDKERIFQSIISIFTNSNLFYLEMCLEIY